MPGCNGIDVIAKAKQLSPDVEAIVLTGKSSLETAVAALRHGAFDYLTKPCKLADLDVLLRRVAEKRELTNKYRALQQRLERIEGKAELIGQSPKMDQVRRLIAKVAPTDSNVLILGETGTGKELVARSVHEQSLRANMPLVPVNCGAMPENLIESELFGHRKGAFTGAEDHRTGLLQVANGGTLFLDEIGELPKAMQAKLLRFLESGEVRRLGDNEATICDVRVVCATNRDLAAMVADGDFREDLWFRINTFEVTIPPLRERIEDIPILANHLMTRFSKSRTSVDNAFSPETLDALMSHAWPGNVRELANVIEHAMILCDEPPIRPEHLPQRFFARPTVPMPSEAAGGSSLREREMQTIQECLDRHNGSKPKAAEELGISTKTLYNKLNQFSMLKKSA
jgi:two-component system NtrC family response regulator